MNHHASNPFVTNEEIRAPHHKQPKLLRLGLPDQTGHIIDIGRFDQDISRPPDAKGRVVLERRIERHRPANTVDRGFQSTLTDFPTTGLYICPSLPSHCLRIGSQSRQQPRPCFPDITGTQRHHQIARL